MSTIDRLVDKYVCGDAQVIGRFDTCRASTSEESCRNAGGKWTPSGVSSLPPCVCPTGQRDCRCETSMACVNGPCIGKLQDGTDTGDCAGVEGSCAAVSPQGGGCFCFIDEEGRARGLCVD